MVRSGVLTVTGIGFLPVQSSAVIIPLYVYPLPGAWDAVVAAKLSHPSVPVVAIVNPSNGPGFSQDPSYVGGIGYLRANGVADLGYVATTYGRKALSDAQAEIDRWYSLYLVDGIFFDEVASSGQEQYLAALNSYAKGRGARLTVGNPGTTIPSSYSGLLDSFVVYEGWGIPGTSGLPGTSCICYGVPSFSLPSAGFDYVFVTDQPKPTAYSVMSSYMGQMTAALDRSLAH